MNDLTTYELFINYPLIFKSIKRAGEGVSIPVLGGLRGQAPTQSCVFVQGPEN